VSKSRLPEPETKAALLPSMGYGPGRPRITEHVYSRTVECVLPDDGDAYEFLFKCKVTGTERRWGTAGRDDEETLS
jgi:hypothetical protein